MNGAAGCLNGAAGKYHILLMVCLSTPAISITIILDMCTSKQNLYKPKVKTNTGKQAVSFYQ